MSSDHAVKRHWRWGAGLAVGLWLAGMGFGFSLLLGDQVRAGVPARAPVSWPASSRVPRISGLPTLLVIAHPRCPCTRATLRELERVIARSGGRASTCVLFVLPRGASGEWSQSALARAARAIPGTTVLIDPDGVEARRFGSSTSGQALLYDPAGQLRFAGGMTPGRGHEGDNAGSDAVVAGIAGASSSITATAVFGCALVRPPSGTLLKPSTQERCR